MVPIDILEARLAGSAASVAAVALLDTRIRSVLVGRNRTAVVGVRTITGDQGAVGRTAVVATASAVGGALIGPVPVAFFIVTDKPVVNVSIAVLVEPVTIVEIVPRAGTVTDLVGAVRFADQRGADQGVWELRIPILQHAERLERVLARILVVEVTDPVLIGTQVGILKAITVRVFGAASVIPRDRDIARTYIQDGEGGATDPEPWRTQPRRARGT